MSRNKIDAVELAKQTIWEGFRLYAEAPGTSTVESHCVSAVCTGVSYEGFNAAISRDPMRAGQIDEVMDLFRRANAPMLWHVWPAQQETSPLYSREVLCSTKRSLRWWLISRSRRALPRRLT